MQRYGLFFLVPGFLVSSSFSVLHIGHGTVRTSGVVVFRFLPLSFVDEVVVAVVVVVTCLVNVDEDEEEDDDDDDDDIVD